MNEFDHIPKFAEPITILFSQSIWYFLSSATQIYYVYCIYCLNMSICVLLQGVGPVL